MSAAEAWICPTCGERVTTPFCPHCGESPLQPPDLTLRGLSAHLLHAETSIDGRLLRTMWCLIRHPGMLTVAHMNGQRKPYIAPFQLFPLANVIFFAMQSLTGTQIFGSSLESHLHHQDWSAFAQSLVSERLAKTQTSLVVYAPVFDRAAVLNAKSLIILMVFPFALLLSLMFLRSRTPFITCVYFSLHLYTFLLLLFSLALLAAALDVLSGGRGLESPRIDTILSVINLVICGAYTFNAARPVFGASGPGRLAKAVALALAAGAIVLGYRFAIFMITSYWT